MPNRDYFPKLTPRHLVEAITAIGSLSEEEQEKYRSYCSIGLDSQGHYKTYRELHYSLPSDLNIDWIWPHVKLVRTSLAMPIIDVEKELIGTLAITPRIQKALSLIDQKTTKAAFDTSMKNLGKESHHAYLLEDLGRDEFISSSQLEGAATTTLAAKAMLDLQRKPRTPDERMIIGNLKMMRYAHKNRRKPLSLAMIREMHAEGVEGIDDARYTPGDFRSAADAVVIEDGEGNIMHTPPAADSVEARLKALIAWIAEPHDSDSQYIHPFIKATTLHFMTGYIHPFKDGNGRVARALFYWFMLQRDYKAFSYLSISAFLKESPLSYGRSYVYTERDDMDLTYFIEYQCKTVAKAIKKYQEVYAHLLQSMADFDGWLLNSRILGRLTTNQGRIILHARTHVAKQYTIRSIEEYLGCSANTASKELNGLVDLEIFVKSKLGKRWVYGLKDPKTLIEQDF